MSFSSSFLLVLSFLVLLLALVEWMDEDGTGEAADLEESVVLSRGGVLMDTISRSGGSSLLTSTMESIVVAVVYGLLFYCVGNV